MEGDNCGDSLKSLYFQHPCKYGIECSGYYSETNDEVSFENTEILNEASVGAGIADETQTEEPIYNEDLIHDNDEDDDIDDDNDDDGEDNEKLVLNTDMKF